VSGPTLTSVQAGVGDVGGLPVGRDRDRDRGDPDVDGLERGVGGGPDRCHRSRGLVDHVGDHRVRPARRGGCRAWGTGQAQRQNRGPGCGGAQSADGVCSHRILLLPVTGTGQGRAARGGDHVGRFRVLAPFGYASRRSPSAGGRRLACQKPYNGGVITHGARGLGHETGTMVTRTRDLVPGEDCFGLRRSKGSGRSRIDPPRCAWPHCTEDPYSRSAVAVSTDSEVANTTRLTPPGNLRSSSRSCWQPSGADAAGRTAGCHGHDDAGRCRAGPKVLPDRSSGLGPGLVARLMVYAKRREARQRDSWERCTAGRWLPNADTGGGPGQ